MPLADTTEDQSPTTTGITVERELFEVSVKLLKLVIKTAHLEDRRIGDELQAAIEHLDKACRWLKQ